MSSAIDEEWIQETAEQYIADNYGTEDDVIRGDEGMWEKLKGHLSAAVSQWVHECHVQARWYEVKDAQEVRLEVGG